MRKHDFVNSLRVFTSRPGSSHIVKAGDHLFISGLSGRTITGSWDNLGKVEEQAKQAFENLAIILEEVGATSGNIVKLLLYLSHHSSWNPVLSILASCLGPTLPPVTGIVVEFPDPNQLLELDVIAFLGPNRAVHTQLSVDAPGPRYFDNAVVADDLVHIGGLTAYGRDEKISSIDDIRVQTEAAWNNLQAICREAGGNLEDLVKLNIFATNPNMHDKIVAFRRDTFPHVRPTSSTVFVSFPDPRLFLMLDGWAYLGKKKPINTHKAFNPGSHGSAQGILLENGLMPIIGISARNLDGSYHGAGNIRDQCMRTMDIIKYILEEAGATYENVVKLVSYISHPMFAPIVQEVRSQYLMENRPALSTVIVRQSSTLILVKTEAWAYLG